MYWNHVGQNSAANTRQIVVTSMITLTRKRDAMTNFSRHSFPLQSLGCVRIKMGIFFWVQEQIWLNAIRDISIEWYWWKQITESWFTMCWSPSHRKINRNHIEQHRTTVDIFSTVVQVTCRRQMNAGQFLRQSCCSLLSRRWITDGNLHYRRLYIDTCSHQDLTQSWDTESDVHCLVPGKVKRVECHLCRRLANRLQQQMCITHTLISDQDRSVVIVLNYY